MRDYLQMFSKFRPKSISRRVFFATALGCLCDNASASPGTKRAFMEAALSGIDSDVAQARAEYERLKGLGARQLFLRLPKILAFGDWDWFYTDGELTWKANLGQQHPQVVVPKGFVSDLASVPQLFWSVLPKTGRYAYAAVVHDFLYWEQSLPREEADRIFKIALEDSGVSRTVKIALYEAVNWAGGAAWEQNKQLKSSGQKRILREFPPNPLISWEDWSSRPGALKG
jgi:hypothetical protein